MIKSWDQFKTYFYLYVLYKDCDDEEDELFFNLDYLRRKLSLYLMHNPYVLTYDRNVYGNISNLDDLIKIYLLKGRL